MTREEAIDYLQDARSALPYKFGEALNMAIEILQTDIVKCENCKHQDECEEIVLFEVTDDEVMGHRVHWCSYGRNK